MKFLDVCTHLTQVIKISLYLSLGNWCDIGKQAMVSKKSAATSISYWDNVTATFPGTLSTCGGGVCLNYVTDWSWKGLCKFKCKIVARLICKCNCVEAGRFLKFAGRSLPGVNVIRLCCTPLLLSSFLGQIFFLLS